MFLKNTKRGSLLGILLLTSAAVIWGFAFSAQKQAVLHLASFSINTLRFFIGGLFLWILVLVRNVSEKKKSPDFKAGHITKTEWIAGWICGTLLSVATNVQQIGLIKADAGTSAFLTALYIVFVPLLGIFLGRKTEFTVWIGVGIALVGAYFLSVLGGTESADSLNSVSELIQAVGKTRFCVSFSEGLILLCAFLFAGQIVAIDRFIGKVDGLRFSMLQYFCAGVVSLPVTVFVERPSLGEIWAALPPVLYLGIMSCGVADTFQTFGQRKTPPAVASVIMSLESVFGAVGGLLVLGESMNLSEILGCILIFSAVLTVEIPAAFPKEKTAGIARTETNKY